MTVGSPHPLIQQLIGLNKPEVNIYDYYINEEGQVFLKSSTRGRLYEIISESIADQISVQTKSKNLSDLFNRVKILSEKEAKMSLPDRETLCNQVWQKFQANIQTEEQKSQARVIEVEKQRLEAQSSPTQRRAQQPPAQHARTISKQFNNAASQLDDLIKGLD